MLTRITLAAVVGCMIAAGQIFYTDQTRVSFDGNTPTPEATWSPQMVRSERGLATLPVPDSNSSRDFWFQSPPVPTGPSWRPPRFIIVSLTLGEFVADGGTMRAFARGYLRYSADRVHWSTWYYMEPTGPASDAPSTFKVTVILPTAVGEQLDRLMMDWWQTKPAWSSDEHEFFVWLATTHRDYFDKEIPVIGYVQVRVEGFSARQAHVATMLIEQSSSGGGLSAIPTARTRTNTDGPWFFDLAKFPPR